MKPTPPNRNTIRSRYHIPVIDKILGRTTLEWTCDNGTPQKLSAFLRFTDYEGYFPSLYSVCHLPFVAGTWLSTRKTALLHKPVPFLVMDAIRYLDSVIKPGMKVLEAGGGNSSIWFLSKGADVTTYEHSREWAATLHKAAEPYQHRHTLKNLQGEAATGDMALLPDQSLDLVLVDCMNDFTRRNECIRVLLPKVKPGGLLILDNSDNPLNWQGAELLKDRNKMRFTGYAPMGLFVCQTTIWTI